MQALQISVPMTNGSCISSMDAAAESWLRLGERY